MKRLDEEIGRKTNDWWVDFLPDHRELFALFGDCLLYIYERNKKTLHSSVEIGQVPSEAKDLLVQIGNRQKDGALSFFREDKVFYRTKNEVWVTGIIVKENRETKENVHFFLSGFTPSLKKQWLLYERPSHNSGLDKRVEALMKVTKKFHVSMGAGAVLKEMITALESIYHSSHITLHLAQHWEVKKDLPDIEIVYGFADINEKMNKAYLSGELQYEETVEDHGTFLYIPLRGRQGVYGVLYMKISCVRMDSDREKDFIKTLADTGGNALENRELYQQSRTLVKDLQLINDTAHILNSYLEVDEIAYRMKKQIKKFIPYGRVVFILLDDDQHLRDSPDPFLKEQNNLKIIFSMMGQFVHSEAPLFISDLRTQPRFHFSGYDSMIAAPMARSGELMGAVLVLGKERNTFTFEQYKLLCSLNHHATLAFSNAILHEKLENMVITDHLTKLHSRHYVEERIRESLMKDKEGTFLLIDIDDFKEINDKYGHQTGDQVIIQVSETIKENIRGEDIAARWGGEELAVYLQQTSPSSGCKVAMRILKCVETNTNPAVTVSCGVANWNNSMDVTVDSLFVNADQAMYQAKRQGKNQVVFSDLVEDTSSC